MSVATNPEKLRAGDRDAWPSAARPVAAVIATVALALLAAGCGGRSARHSASSTNSAQAARQTAALAFARCMRSHGVPNFPDPNPQGDFPPFHTGVSKQTSSAANGDCKHLLSSGGSTGTPQQRRQKFAFALKVAQCLRTHGFPNFPDPTASGQGVPPGIDTNSPRFQAAETACEKQARNALGLP